MKHIAQKTKTPDLNTFRDTWVIAALMTLLLLAAGTAFASEVSTAHDSQIELSNWAYSGLRG